MSRTLEKGVKVGREGRQRERERGMCSTRKRGVSRAKERRV